MREFFSRIFYFIKNVYIQSNIIIVPNTENSMFIFFFPKYANNFSNNGCNMYKKTVPPSPKS